MQAPAVHPPMTRFVVLIPAHNEEQGIGWTLEGLRAQNYPDSLRRVIVIADNCQDATAQIVKKAGFECWERVEPELRGKGQALRWALDRLTPDAWDAVVFFDADTRMDRNFLEEVDSAIQAGARAVTGRGEFELSESYVSILTFASKKAENELYWRPRERFGCMGFIAGNCFCLKREVLEIVTWSAYSIVEDFEYAIELALHGVRVKFLESARVVSHTTRETSVAGPQRLRWASGTFGLIPKYVPKLLTAGIREGSGRLMEMALALSMTSRFLLLYLVAAAVALSWLLGPAGIGNYVRAGALVSLIMLCIYVAIVLSRIPSVRGSRLRAIIWLPIYAGWMLLVHLAAAVGARRNLWVRTAR
jgi:cellulose synthase/poly-beta-1,6-N-acetylglucosamine synthase-like glycosyltransferase